MALGVLRALYPNETPVSGFHQGQRHKPHQSPDVALPARRWLQSSPSYRHNVRAWQTGGDHVREPAHACMTAFGSTDQLASWVGVCPGNNKSVGKRKSGRVRKANPYVRRLLCEFAHAASRAQSAFKARPQALTVRRGHKRAIIAITHKLLRTIFFMLKRSEHYRDSATDYEMLSAQRNAPRWIKALTRYGLSRPRRPILTSPHHMVLMGRGPARLSHHLFHTNGHVCHPCQHPE